MTNGTRLVLFISLLAFLASCGSQKKMIYFQGEIPAMKEAEKYTLKIYPGDVLSVSVFTINAEAYPYFSYSLDKPVSDNRSPYEKGIVVNDSGLIKLPLIGNVKISGMTLAEATRELELKLRVFIDDPIVTLKKLNFKVTVLGEVNKPGTYPILNEKVSLPEAIGMAGDISQFGDRQQLRIIREENNQLRDFYVDLTSAASLKAEIYYLQPDDIIYVQPVKRRALLNISPAVTIFTSVITTAVIAMTFIITQTR